jgi:hypothetical protein
MKIKSIYKLVAIISVMLNIIIISALYHNVSADTMALKKSILSYPIYLNGDEIQLTEGYIIEGRTYIQLKEFCEKANLQVDWIDSAVHQSFPPGGGLPEGINLTNPTFIYSKSVNDIDGSGNKFEGIEITGIYQKYRSTDAELIYSFDDEGLVIREAGSIKVIPISYNPNSGRIYVDKMEFKEKILPYLVEICEQ